MTERGDISVRKKENENRSFENGTLQGAPAKAFRKLSLFCKKVK